MQRAKWYTDAKLSKKQAGKQSFRKKAVASGSADTRDKVQ